MIRTLKPQVSIPYAYKLTLWTVLDMCERFHSSNLSRSSNDLVFWALKKTVENGLILVKQKYVKN